MNASPFPGSRLATSALLVLGLAACGGSDNGDGGGTDGSNDDPATGATTLSVDATAGGLGAPPDDPDNQYTYVSLDDGAVVDLTDQEAAGSQDWDIAFKRTSVKLNGGVSGPGPVQGAIADEQSEFYDGSGNPDASVFTNATAESERPAFENVESVSGLSFTADERIPAITGDGTQEGWWLYDPQTRSVSANDDAWWMVRSAEADLDSYAKLRVSNIVQNTREITFELFIQEKDQNSFQSTAVTYTATLGSGGGTACYDFDTTSEVGCDSGGWDFQVEVDGRSWSIWLNGGASGDGEAAAFGPVDDPDNYPSGTMTGTGQPYGQLYSTDATGGVFEEYGWYAYNLQDNRRLWPNYRVYAIDTGAAYYKLQILSYYDDAGTSGIYTIRFAEVEGS